jgi:putative membrane protein
MERPAYLRKKNILIPLYSIYIVGFIGHLIEYTRELMFRLTPMTLLVSSILVIAYSFRSKRLAVWFAVTYLATFTLEVLGVKTGLVFGSYAYGNVLGLKLFEVPIIIGLNWVIIIWGGILFSQRIYNDSLGVATATASLALIFDIFLEPVAISFRYWNWENISVPIHNYAAWFIISFVFSFIYTKLKVSTYSNIPVHLFFMQLFFFLLLNLIVIG